MEPMKPWLESLAAELDVDLARHVSELQAQHWTPGEIALSILDCAFPNGTTPEAVLRVRCYPWEKSRLVKAARGEKLNEWMRRHLIRAAMESENED